MPVDQISFNHLPHFIFRQIDARHANLGQKIIAKPVGPESAIVDGITITDESKGLDHGINIGMRGS